MGEVKHKRFESGVAQMMVTMMMMMMMMMMVMMIMMTMNISVTTKGLSDQKCCH